MDYEYKKGIVWRNGSKLICPFSPGGNFCGDWCPHFDAVESPNSYNIRTYCVHTVRAIVVERKAE